VMWSRRPEERSKGIYKSEADSMNGAGPRFERFRKHGPWLLERGFAQENEMLAGPCGYWL
jgi:hypothetical protein